MCTAVCKGSGARGGQPRHCEASRTADRESISRGPSSLVWEDVEARHTNARVLGPHTATAQGELTHLLCKLLLHLHYLYSCLQCFDAVVGRQEGHLACKKNWVVGAGMVICLERGADLHMAQLMPLPLTVSCFSKIQIGFSFLVLAHPGSPGHKGR